MDRLSSVFGAGSFINSALNFKFQQANETEKSEKAFTNSLYFGYENGTQNADTKSNLSKTSHKSLSSNKFYKVDDISGVKTPEKAFESRKNNSSSNGHNV